MRKKREYRSAGKQVYLHFCQAHPDIQITFERWKQIIYTCNKMFITHALVHTDPVKLPSGFGVLAVHKWQTRQSKTDQATGATVITLPVDWKKTRQEGRKIYNFNFHTSGYSYKWKWFAKMARLPETPIWVFKPSRESSREITRYVNGPGSGQQYKEFSQGTVKMYVG